MEISDADLPAVSIRGLTKRYGKTWAVRGLNLDVHRGEVLGFLGLNGAGKSTTIRILLDLLRPTSGRASVFGRDCQKETLLVRARVGYLPGEIGLFSDLRGIEVLDFLAGLSPQTVDLKFRGELQERLQMSDRDLGRKWSEYSTGMKRKVGIMQAFQADPPLLILDEPTEGLDPLMQAAFYDLLAQARGRGRTVFMSSHVLTEVERVCDRVALLRQGELVLLSAVEEIRQLAPRRVRVTFTGDVPSPTALPPGCVAIEVGPRTWSLDAQSALGPLLPTLAKLPVADLEVEDARLEDVLLRFYGQPSP